MKRQQEPSTTFAERFFRSQGLLTFIACRVLGDEERASIAVENCRRTASRNFPHFDYEGAFRSWLVRILLDEALAIHHESQAEKTAAATVLDGISPSDSTVKPGLE